ncbi:sodium:proton antiporter [Periweissella fabaria]|uniref:Sodium, potassium, lithium and rubidium/H(+) antiporter n=1 Tax=Periweissella fabaria TaxID=546157 RepID=A0ABM8Z709_9LACO|nr:sodium:proton antiporter [Periweissella fabaria]MCM0597735.1 sodium:proton antiporter [Periweissella fabaria]CAH0417184.1 Sodium, potassium, lithium and rubidium/H(+) antiporter [Periweissella fabaria]
MPILELVLLLIVLVISSHVIGQVLPKIPVSIIQIALGILVAMTLNVSIKLETSWFLLLFIAPLLFNDAWRFPKRELWELRGPIFGNAIILVLITTGVGGYLINLLIPEMPLTAAIALAAILSPTDPVAVHAIAKSVHLPENIMHLVAGESLINDASGLVAFKFAIAATVSVSFHFTLGSAVDIFSSMFITTALGIIVGLVVMQIINAARDYLLMKGIDDIIFHVVLQLITPFVVFFIAEEGFHASGVIAVVAAGILANLHDSKKIGDSPELSLITINSWNIISYILNGLLFVILGIELPLATQINTSKNDFDLLTVILYAFIVWFIIFAIRVLWVYGGQIIRKLVTKDTAADAEVSFKVAVLSGLTGVRGAITMAGILSVPVAVQGGEPFPMRELMIGIAALAILFSLIIAVVTLPFVADKIGKVTFDEDDTDDLELDDDHETEAVTKMKESDARIFTLQMAIRTLESKRRENNQTTVYDIILKYQFLIRKLQLQAHTDAEIAPVIKEEIEVRKVGFDLEQQCLMRLLAEEQIDPLVYHSEIRQIERQERELESYLQQHFVFSSKWIERSLRSFFRLVRIWFSDGHTAELQAQYDLARHEMAKAAIKGLSEYIEQHGREHQYKHQAVYNLIIQYRNRIEKIKLRNQDDPIDTKQQYSELAMIALNTQREGVNLLQETQQITSKTAMNLRQAINYSENAVLNEFLTH